MVGLAALRRGARQCTLLAAGRMPTAIIHAQPRRGASADGAAKTKPESQTVADDEAVGPGTTDRSRIASDFEQAAGLERIEMLAKLAGRSAFLMEPLKVDHYGTLADPILVDSMVGRRLVGCTGFPKYSHEVLWFWVGGDVDGVDAEAPPIRCQECGQAFRINKLQ